ncbi:MAG TPA: tetratricopeptide repeat protein, partial [Opitutaceae bacterium]
PPMLRGWSQKEAGRYPEAVRQYGLALQKGGDPDKICPLMAAAYLTEGDAASAAAMLAKYHEKSPHSIPILLSYCETAVRLKDDKLARSLLEQVLQAEPYLYLPNMSLAQILWASGERDAAAQCLLRVARVFPADIDSRGLLGQYYMEKSEPESAIPPLEQAVALAGAGHPKRERLTAMLDSAYLLDGSLQASQGHYAQAVAFSEKSIALNPGGFRGFALKANASMRMKDYKRAKEALATMAALQPANPSVRMSLGDMEYQDGDREAARQDWQRALQLAPADAAEMKEAIARRLAGHFPSEALP